MVVGYHHFWKHPGAFQRKSPPSAEAFAEATDQVTASYQARQMAVMFSRAPPGMYKTR